MGWRRGHTLSYVSYRWQSDTKGNFTKQLHLTAQGRALLVPAFQWRTLQYGCACTCAEVFSIQKLTPATLPAQAPYTPRLIRQFASYTPQHPSQPYSSLPSPEHLVNAHYPFQAIKVREMADDLPRLRKSFHPTAGMGELAYRVCALCALAPTRSIVHPSEWIHQDVSRMQDQYSGTGSSNDRSL